MLHPSTEAAPDGDRPAWLGPGAWAQLLALVVVALALYGQPLARGEVFGGWGSGGDVPPWSAPRGRVNNLADHDTVQLELPVTIFVHRTGAAWDPHRGLGEPIGLAGWPTLTHPLAWPLTRALEPGRATLWLSFLHVVSGGVVCLLHLRWRGLGRAALAGAIAFEMAPLFTSWASRPFISAAMPWGALALWAADAMARRPGPRPAAALAVAVGGGLLSAFPQLSLLVSLAAAALAVAGAGRAWPRASAWTCSALGLGALLAAPRLVPLGAFMAWSSREVVPFAEWHARTAQLGPEVLWRLLLPDIAGHPARGFLAEHEGMYTNMQELRLYPGLPVLVLALAGGAARGARRFAAAAAVAVVLAFPTPLAIVLWVVPGFAGSSPARVLWLLPFLTPVLCAEGMRALLLGRRGPLVAAGVVAAAAVVAALSLGTTAPLLLGPLSMGPWPGGLPGVHRFPDGLWLLSPTLGPLLLSLVTLGLVAGARHRLAAAALVGLIAAELVREGQLYRSTAPVGAHYRPVPVARAALAAAGPDRALLRPPLFPHALMPAGLRGVGSYGALHSERLTALLGALGQPPDQRQLIVPVELPAAWRDALAVRVVLDAPGSPPPAELEGLVLLNDGRDARLWVAPEALPRARLHPPEAVVEVPDLRAALALVTADGVDPRQHVLLETGVAGAPPAADVEPPVGVEVLVDEPEEVVLRAAAPRGGVLVLADSFAPGWTCEADDGATLELLPAQVAVRGVRLPAGFDGTLSFRYRTPGLRAGLLLAALAGVAAAALAWRGRGPGGERP